MNPVLVSLDGLEALRTIDGALWLQRNPVLTDLTALYGLSAVGSVDIEWNAALGDTAASALVSEIDTIHGAVTVAHNN